VSRSADTLAARVTEPLAFADDWVNAGSDWAREHAPYAWWPAPPPDPRRPVGWDAHAAYLLQTVLLDAAVEAVQRVVAEPPSRAKLWRGRALGLAATVVGAAITSGAWDRRAARRRWFR
jgi:hypothetical protein